ncbi:2-oxoacid:ferredoxin oxidoreductase subunit beta [Thermococci archaeon]|nr:MAG: 2-oxoacid:ferredoxin oxidoreductase subunit beta [Thermococci archaeon]
MTNGDRKRMQDLILVERFPHIFCPGCGNGVVLKATYEAISTMDREFVFLGGIGCSARIATYFRGDVIRGAHGRALPIATGIKSIRPDVDVIVFTGDGDASAIGGNHLIHSARRNLDVTVVCVNNFVYGMTGGQVAPTTPKGKKTSTTPEGNEERPFDISKLVLAAGASYVARWTVLQFKPLVRSIRRGIETKGFSFIEVLSPCPVGFGRRNDMSIEELWAMYRDLSRGEEIEIGEISRRGET